MLICWDIIRFSGKVLRTERRNMGEKFALAFDIAVIVILAVFAFAGLKRGFAKVALGLVSTIAAFAVAVLLSGPIASAVYGNFVEKPISEKFDDAAGEVFGDFTLGNIADLDFSKAKINGTYADETEPDYAGTRKAVVDLSKLDLSETGLTKEDLLKLGVNEDSSLKNLNGKTAEFSMDDIEKHGLGKLATAQYIAAQLVKLPKFKSFTGITDSIRKYVPSISGSAASDSTGVSAARSIVLSMIDTKDNLKGAVMNGMIKPNCTLLIRTIAFGVIFILATIALRIVTAATNLVTKIPVLNKVNSLFGLILGIVEGLITVFIVCLVTRLIVSLSSANSILFNQTAIDSTFLFKIFYNFDFLNFLK